MIGLNRLRTAYAQAPPSLRRALSPFLSAIPVRYRLGRTYVTYRNYIERSRHDREFVTQWRRDRLRTLVQTAVLKSPYYRRVAARAGLDSLALEDFDVSDLVRFPILTKEELRGHAQEFLTSLSGRLDEVSTSGSSGTPLNFYLDKDRSAKEWAFIQDAWSKTGFEPGCIRAVLRGVHLDNVDRTPWEFDPALAELRLSPFHLTDAWMEKYCALILRYGVTYLQGYPSAMSIFANYVLRMGREDVSSRIKGVIASSEALLAHQRKRIVEAFPGARVTSYYGMSEKILFGSELVDEAGTFEMEPLYGIVELVDDLGNTVAQPGERGRIIGTGLLFRGMPFIRYDTGDLAILAEAASAENFFRAKVKAIKPRRGQEYLVGINGQLISMTAINIHSPVYAKMSAFQFHQTEAGKATLRVVPAPGCSKGEIVPFINEVSAKVGASLAFDIEIVDQIAHNLHGKSKFIDQHIELNKWQ